MKFAHILGFSVLSVHSSHEKTQLTQLLRFKNKKTTPLHHTSPTIPTYPILPFGLKHLQHASPKDIPHRLGDLGALAVNDSGEMAMAQGFAERQRGAVRGGVIDRLGRDGSHLGFFDVWDC